jgi:predicted nucleic acid-binding protein
MSELVLDSSITMSWCFPDESDPYARTVLAALPSSVAYVSSVWPLEVANVLLVGERRNRINEADARLFVTLLGSLPITVDRETPERALREVLDLGRAQRLSAYDASYLELAMRRGLPLATLDDRLRNAATSAGVSLFAPG